MHLSKFEFWLFICTTIPAMLALATTLLVLAPALIAIGVASLYVVMPALMVLFGAAYITGAVLHSRLVYVPLYKRS